MNFRHNTGCDDFFDELLALLNQSKHICHANVIRLDKMCLKHQNRVKKTYSDSIGLDFGIL